jgi:ubiquinol-cytochrome c reductase cytochrome c subunit
MVRAPVAMAGLLVAVVAGLFAAQRATAGTTVVRQAPPPSPELVQQGRELYLTGCASCHGGNGEGTDRAPSVVNAGAASASFYLTTGRMPAAQGVPFQPPRKQPAYPPEQIDALVAYVASLGTGPPIPVVDVANADVSQGGVLYRANCAACHQSAGAGGALSYGNAAPPLRAATAEQVVEAMRIGPGEMPVFNEATFSDAQADDISAYVQYLRNPDNRGGAALGGNGPVPEGLVALIAGLGGLVFISVLIVGRRRRSRRPPVGTETT